MDEKAVEQTRSDAMTPVQFESIELINAQSVYYDQEEAPFIVGPISFCIHPGEMIFITGGNGSGKSTLAKLLTGLYVPDSGVIRWNGVTVTNENRDDYRQLFAVVFFDFFLFETLLGLESPDLDARAAAYLEALELQHKVQIKDGILSTTSLSQGQRKRLALLTAYLENRPIYVFDEWAADQDPTFKEVFYRKIAPELKAQGKTVVIITHDDRYFHLADRHFEMREGKLKECR